MEYEDYDVVEYRQKRNLPRSVSVYDELQTESAHQALLDASKSLFQLADYVEANFLLDDSDNRTQVDGVQDNKVEINDNNKQK